MRTLILRLLVLFAAIAPFASAASTPQWVEVRSPHFVVITDSDEKRARQLAGQFERMRSLFQTVLPHAASDAGIPMTVLAFKDRKGFQSVLPASYLAKGQIQLDGFFLRTPDRNYILLRLDAETEHPYSIVYHEYTHFILRKADWIPLWLNEGLAEFYQNTDIEGKDVRLGQPSVDNILYLRQNRLLPLSVLLAVDHNSPYYHDEQKGSVFYAESWALTHFIEINDMQRKTHRLNDYALLLSHHEDPVTAAQHAFGDLNQLQKALESYVAQSSYQEVKLNSTFTADDASFKARPIPLSDVNSIRADVLAANDRKADAKALLESVLRDDPKNALAHETMGSLAYREHDPVAARRWYSEAVQLDSQSYLAHYNYAVYSMMDGVTDQNAASIEASLRQAIKLEPSFAPSYDALAHFYALRHKDLDQAHLLTLAAVQLEPEEIRYRLNSAQIEMEREKPESALSILQNARKIAKSDGDIQLVDRQIEQIERFTEQRKLLANSQPPAGTVTAYTVGMPAAASSAPEPPPFPRDPPAGPHLVARGVLHSVHCSYPTVLTLTLDQPGKPLSLYTNNYFKVEFSTANYISKEDIDPCKTIEGMKAKIEYTSVTDKRVAGQIVSIQLSK